MYINPGHKTVDPITW